MEHIIILNMMIKINFYFFIRMNTRKDNIFFEGKIIGVLHNPSLDNFHYYGTWQAADDSPLYQRFLAAIAGSVGAFVEIGCLDSKLVGTVGVVPDRDIDIVLRIK